MGDEQDGWGHIESGERQAGVELSEEDRRLIFSLIQQQLAAQDVDDPKRSRLGHIRDSFNSMRDRLSIWHVAALGTIVSLGACGAASIMSGDNETETMPANTEAGQSAAGAEESTTTPEPAPTTTERSAYQVVDSVPEDFSVDMSLDVDTIPVTTAATPTSSTTSSTTTASTIAPTTTTTTTATTTTLPATTTTVVEAPEESVLADPSNAVYGSIACNDVSATIVKNMSIYGTEIFLNDNCDAQLPEGTLASINAVIFGPENLERLAIGQEIALTSDFRPDEILSYTQPIVTQPAPQSSNSSDSNSATSTGTEQGANPGFTSYKESCNAIGGVLGSSSAPTLTQYILGLGETSETANRFSRKYSQLANGWSRFGEGNFCLLGDVDFS